MPYPILTQLRPEFSGTGTGIGGTKLSFQYLLSNPHPMAFAILKPDLDRLADPALGQSYIREYEKVYMSLLSTNTGSAAVEWLIEHRKYINDIYFSKNPHPTAVAYYAANPARIHWRTMSKNLSAAAVVLMRANKGRIFWNSLSSNTHPDAIELLMETPDNVFWNIFSGNSSAKAVDILRKNRDKVYWPALSFNSHPDAVALLLEKPENIVYRWFLRNPAPEALLWNKMHLHRIRPEDYAGAINNTNPDAILWISEITAATSYNRGILWKHPSVATFEFIRKNGILPSHSYDESNGVPCLASKNPDIFEDVYDYASIRANMDLIREDLAKACGHPGRLMRHLETGGDPDDF